MDRAQPADEDLIILAGKGDDSALELLYDRYSGPVFSLALRIVQNQQVAEELTQEVFLRIWRQAATYRRERGRFASWVFGITHHLAVDEIRRAQSRPQQVHDDPASSWSLLEVADSQPNPDQAVLSGLRRDQIVSALESLPGNQREVIELSYFRGLTQSEIAERTGEPLGTIKTRTRLALLRLRSTLLEQGLSPDAV
ncbi:MAG: sigma-70 family RNA polymerase sigma factor [Chloroflexota bacterium]|nr:sigma-70 family RNA polymerase sigma factor [Chloroflexota bacterium]